MPFILALLGAAAAVFFYVNRARNAANAVSDIADVANDVGLAIRRFGFKRRANTHPVDDIDSVGLAVAGIALSFVSLDGPPLQNDQDMIQRTLENRYGMNETASQEAMVLGRWFIGECGNATMAFERITKRLFKIGGVETVEGLMAVLSATASDGDIPFTTRQSEAISDVKRIFRL